MLGFMGLQHRTAEMASTEKRNLMGEWADLCQDLLILIAKRIHQYEDFVAFGGVCRSWRCAAVKENFDLSVQIPWLMLSEEEVVGSHHQGFVSLSKGGMVRRVFLPEARGKHCISSMGWLMSTDPQYNNMELLHPLTRRQIPLPCLVSCRLPLEQAVLSASPSYTGDYVLMVLIASQLYFWKPGNKVWKMVGLSSCRWYSNVIYYKDKFYAIDTNLSLFLCDNNSGNTHAVGHVSPSMQLAFAEAAYLVKSANELLLVLWGRRRGHPTVKVYKYCDSSDMMNNNWQKIYNLGVESIFVGSSVATAVPVNAATEIKPNCIYFSWYMEIYNFESRTIEPMPEVCSPKSSSTWVIPSF